MSAAKRPTWREVNLLPLRFRVEPAAVQLPGEPGWIVYRASDEEHARLCDTWREAMDYALAKVLELMVRIGGGNAR